MLRSDENVKLCLNARCSWVNMAHGRLIPQISLISQICTKMMTRTVNQLPGSMLVGVANEKIESAEQQRHHTNTALLCPFFSQSR